jgi:membrane protein implicated in regulation of membrane protease activity
VLATTFSLAFDIVFGVFVVAIIVLTVLTVRFVIRRDRSRR